MEKKRERQRDCLDWASRIISSYNASIRVDFFISILRINPNFYSTSSPQIDLCLPSRRMRNAGKCIACGRNSTRRISRGCPNRSMLKRAENPSQFPLFADNSIREATEKVSFPLFSFPVRKITAKKIKEQNPKMPQCVLIQRERRLNK